MFPGVLGFWGFGVLGRWGVSYFFFNWACDYGVRDDHYLFSPNKERLKNSHHWAGDSLVDCPTQLTLVTWICQLCSTKNNSEKYKRTQQGNLLKDAANCATQNILKN